MRHIALTSLALLTIAALLAAGCTKVPKEPASGGAETATAPETAAPTETTEGAAAQADYLAPGTQAALEKGIDYLRKTQLEDGGWQGAPDNKNGNLGVTCVATLGLVKAGVPAGDPMVDKAVKFILGFIKEDGGIYDNMLRNYTTSISVMLLKATGDPNYDGTITKAVGFLKDLQWDQGEGIGYESPDFGGTGYGEHQRPDLSNQQWFIQAVREAGLSPDDEAVKKALVFVKRTQGGEDATWIGLPDGGFIYSPHGGGESKAGKVLMPSRQEGLKAYGSMTYAGFLSLIYAGLDRQDKRVQAALEWAGKHWTLEENPEMGQQGLFYYYMCMAKALSTYGSPTIKDGKGIEHAWQKELSAKLVAIQKEDGSWINEADRWMEGNNALVTGEVLITLGATMTDLSKGPPTIGK